LVIVDEDSAVLQSSENWDVVISPAPEPAQVTVTASLLLNAEMPAPSPVVGVQDPPLAVEVAESSSTWVALTTEEVMELTTCRYIDFPNVGVIDLEVPQFPEKVFEVAAERMFNEPSVMETIASVSKALQEYERAGGFAPAVAVDRRMWASRRPRLTWSQQQMCPCRCRSMKVEERRLPSRWKLLKVQPLS
jgi:hypothetical protein